jgi:putative oxidoreductase
MFERILSPYAEAAYAALRIVSGLNFAFHGVQKLFGVLSEHTPPVLSQIWVGGVIELVAGTLIALGLWARCAAFIASGMMAVAYTQFHWKLQFDSNFFPTINKGELALIYAFVFLFIACRGAGRASLESVVHKRAT